jgi:TRAP-type C4-dicarboxylate transport system permease small subunit
MKALALLAKGCAILAGILLVFITLMTVTSVLGRDVLGKPIVGDFELSGAIAGAAVALFMPWCQAQRGNIIVDFFTSGASEASRHRMDRAGTLLLAVMMAFVAWRTTVGGLNAYNTNSGSTILGFPDWITYAFMVPPLALTAVIAVFQVAFGFGDDAAESNPELSV